MNHEIFFGVSLLHLALSRCFIAMLLWATCPALHAETAAEGTALLGTTITKIVKALDKSEGPTSASDLALRHLQAQLEQFETLLNSGNIKPNTDLQELFASYADVISLNEDDLKNPAALADIDAITHDVAIKNNFLAGRAAMIGERQSMEVTVRVNLFQLDTRQALTGYQVLASPLALARKDRWLFRFSGPTNDAVRNLPPGSYLFRVSQNNIRMEREYDVGTRGEPIETKTLYLNESNQ